MTPLGLLSITIGWPNATTSLCETMRTIRSTPPPASEATIRMGLYGYGSAALVFALAITAADRQKATTWGRIVKKVSSIVVSFRTALFLFYHRQLAETADL